MTTLELIIDSALHGGYVPNERVQEVRDFLDDIESQLKQSSLDGYGQGYNDATNDIFSSI